MLADERYQIILDMAKGDGIVKTVEIQDKLQVSRETVRRDLNFLEGCGKLSKIFGGAKLPSAAVKQGSSAYEPFHARTAQNAQEKIRIARMAASFVEEGQSVALDSGTTAVELAMVLKAKFKRLTVVTNSLNVLDALSDAPDFTVILTGGIYKSDERSFVSDLSTAIFSTLSIKTFFLTTCGVSIEKGVTYQRVDELLAQRKMVECSQQTILIADSSKIGENSLVRMCGLEDISMIITDDKIDERQRENFSRVGVKIVVAENK